MLDDYSANKNALSKQARASQTQNIDEATYEWYQKARIKNILLTGPMLPEKKPNERVKSFETQNSQRLMDGITDSRKGLTLKAKS